MSDCLTEPDFERYHAGDLSHEETTRVAAHLGACAECRRRDAELVRSYEEIVVVARVVGRSAAPLLGVGLNDALQPTVGIGAGTPLETAATAPGVDAIPGYEILKELYRGGQGVVYQAIQKSTKRKVALKVLLEGPFASERSKRRFEREIELVASLHHPNIVAIFDSGISHERYWFAMDYIRGEPLDRYISARSLPIDAALQLFVKICAAINYAHQRGVIHRDLKPSNILVDSQGEPHVLDFGLAKVAGAEAVGDSRPMLVSITGQVIGTLPYMSPEQARGDPEQIDIRTDVYSLGVILYEMLTGKYPYDVGGQMADVLRNIAEAAPRRPSTIRRQINDEVETIVLKALAKEPPRRYQSAQELSRDVQHYLAGEAIDARRDSGWYLLKKTLRRHRVAAIFCTTLLVVISVSAAVTLTLWRAAALQRQRVAELEHVLNRTSELLASDSYSLQGTAPDLPEEWALSEFGDHPALEAALRHITAHRLSAQGQAAPAIEQAQVALRIRARVLGLQHPQTLASTALLSWLLTQEHRFGEAEPLQRQLVDALTNREGAEHPDALKWMNNLSVSLRELGKLDEAESVNRQTLAAMHRVYPENDPRLQWARANLAALLVRAQKFEEAEPIALAIQREGWTGFRGFDLRVLVDLYEGWGKPEQAAAWRAKLAATGRDTGK